MKRLLWLLLLVPALCHATVTTQVFSVSFTCNGTSGPFPFAFPISDATAMTVTQGGILLNPSTYTVTPVNNNFSNGGTVNLNSNCTSSITLALKRQTPLTQTTVFTDNMPVPMKSFENGLDKLTEIDQEQQAQITPLQFLLAPQLPNYVFAGPAGGGNAPPTFRALTAADIPITGPGCGGGNCVSTAITTPQTMAGPLVTPWVGTTYSVPVELFGAVGDATGAPGVGTDNTTAIQNCINALTAGQCMLQNKKYRITSAISITSSNVGIGGVSYAVANSTLYPTPSASTIVIDSASADAIDAAGTNMGTNITYNRFTNFTISRTQAPTGSARGLSIQFSYGAIVEGVTSNDSIAPFYFHGVGSQGTGHIENCAALWGYNGFADTTSGNYGGFVVDSTGGVAPNNSFRIRNVFIAENSNISHTGGVVTYGVDVSGSNVNDFHSFHVETAGVDYGIAVGTSNPAFGASSDIFISEAVLDQTWVSAIKLNGIVGGATINGGDFVRSDSTTSNAPIVDIETSTHVIMSNAGLNSTNSGVSGPSVLLNSSSSIRIEDNDFGVNYGDGIDLANTPASTITGNVIVGVHGGTVISLSGTSTSNSISANIIQGVSATNGILICSTCTNIRGVGTNYINPVGVTTALNDTSHNAAGVSGNCVQWAADGSPADAGAPCGSGGGGGGTVTSFAAPSGSWPTWLVPTVTNPTTTPSLAVSASSIPNAALANSATTVNGTTCTLGSTCNPYPLTTSGSLPGTCTTGQLWTNPSPTNTGNVIYECWTTNTWAPMQPSMPGTPSISASSGAGSGSGGTAAFISGETDGAGWFTVSTGTSTTASAGVVTVSYSVTYPVTPKCSVFPADTNSAALSGTGQVWVSQGSSTGALFVLRVGSTPLATSTTYTFGYKCALL